MAWYKLFILKNLFIFGCAGPWLFHMVSSLGATSEGCFLRRSAHSHSSGFSCCRAPWVPGCAGFSSRGTLALEHKLGSCGMQA